MSNIFLVLHALGLAIIRTHSPDHITRTTEKNILFSGPCIIVLPTYLQNLGQPSHTVHLSFPCRFRPILHVFLTTPSITNFRYLHPANNYAKPPPPPPPPPPRYYCGYKYGYKNGV